MKKLILCILATLLILLSGLTLIGCDKDSNKTATPNYNENVVTVAPEEITAEHFIAENNPTYYTSPKLTLWMSVNGHYLKMDYFSLDGNKRIYDNMYFYEKDYFYMLTNDYKYLYASIKDSNSQYIQAETQSGEDVQVNVLKTGIYKLIFDVDTLKFDIEFKSEIETPVYYTMQTCSVYTNATKWVEMAENPNNPEEFYINNLTITEETIAFYSNLHTSQYKVTLNSSCNNTYASSTGLFVYVNVDGNYNVYINKKTYVVRLELNNPENASYSCIYYDGTDFISLQSQEAPYIFKITINAEKYDYLPKFYSAKYKEYDLSRVASTYLTSTAKSALFKQAGTYNVFVNLKTFEISVELLPQ